MSFYVWCEIVCPGCAHTLPGQHALGDVPRADMTKQAKTAGWKLFGKEWLCQGCTRRKEGEKKPAKKSSR